jgi:hypothetical protein
MFSSFYAPDITKLVSNSCLFHIPNLLLHKLEKPNVETILTIKILKIKSLT